MPVEINWFRQRTVMAAKSIRWKVDGEKDIHVMLKYHSTDNMWKGENISLQRRQSAITTLIKWSNLTSLIVDNQTLCVTWCNALWSTFHPLLKYACQVFNQEFGSNFQCIETAGDKLFKWYHEKTIVETQKDTLPKK